MLILTIRTDKPEAELGLYNDKTRVDYETWLAHRQLAETIHKKMKGLLEKHGYSWQDIQGLVVFRGPGSFTGLRIGASVTNALADSLGVPVIGGAGDDWVNTGIVAIQAGNDDKLVVPDYGSLPHTTPPRR